jgi:hypothetical protein
MQRNAARARRRFTSKREQMEYWLTDPILRPEAMAWARGQNYQLVYDEMGNPIAFTNNPEGGARD